MRTLRLWLLISLVAAVVGFAADVRLRHPQTGQSVVCPGGYCPGVECLPAQQRQFRCIDDYQRQGYERIQ